MLPSSAPFWLLCVASASASCALRRGALPGIAPHRTLMPLPSPNDFQLMSAVEVAFALINGVIPIWMIMIGTGIGTAVLGLILSAIREVMP